MMPYEREKRAGGLPKTRYDIIEKFQNVENTQFCDRISYEGGNSGIELISNVEIMELSESESTYSK